MDTLELTVLRKRGDWEAAVGKLRALAESGADRAREAATEYAQVYAGRRGAMVIDVVASRQRRYTSRVLPLVARWLERNPNPSLASLAEGEIDPTEYGLQAGEPITMRTVARNLHTFCMEVGSNEDDGCLTWAESVRGLEHAPKLDPVVGGVKGIGPALFAYLRMRCGADALKPDLRVVRGLRELGFDIPADEHSVMVVARGASAEVDLTLLELDQLLWGPRGT